MLQTARESASQIKVRAEENAARALREAHDEANRLRQEAEVESARRRQDAQSEAEAEVALAKQQGREMVNEARAYRERVLADLERRTKLARQHIEELAHGRERLLQVFERARLVAVDVTAELQAFDRARRVRQLLADHRPGAADGARRTARLGGPPTRRPRRRDAGRPDRRDRCGARRARAHAAEVAIVRSRRRGRRHGRRTAPSRTPVVEPVDDEPIDEPTSTSRVDESSTSTSRSRPSTPSTRRRPSRQPTAQRGDHNVVALFPNRPTTESSRSSRVRSTTPPIPSRRDTTSTTSSPACAARCRWAEPAGRRRGGRSSPTRPLTPVGRRRRRSPVVTRRSCR